MNTERQRERKEEIYFNIKWKLDLLLTAIQLKHRCLTLIMNI